MLSFIKPIVLFMKRLDYKKKFTIIAVAIILPFISPAFLSYQSLFKEISILQNEQTAIGYIKALKELIKTIQQHRGMMEGYLKGDVSFKKDIEILEKEIDKSFENLKRFDAKEGKVLKNLSTFIEAERIWKSVKLKNFKKNEMNSFDLHTKLLSNIIIIIKEVSNIFDISRDKNIENYYLSIAVFDKIPNLAEYLGRMRGYITGILANNKITKENERELIEMYALIYSALESVYQNLFHYIKANPKTSHEIKKRVLKSRKLIEEYLKRVNRLISDKNLENEKPKKFFSYATSIIDEVFMLYDTVLQKIETDLKKREKETIVMILFYTAGLFITIFIAFILFAGIYYSTIKSLEKIQRASLDISKGNFDVDTKVDTKDEMADVAKAFEKMAYEIKKQISFLEGYKKALDASSLVIKMDSKGFITYANDSFLEVSGCSKDYILGKEYSDLICPDMVKEISSKIWETIKSKKIWKGVIKNRKKNGEFFITITTIVPITNEKGDVKEYVVAAYDVTELVNSKEQIRKMLYFDTLTNLPNRTKLLEDLKRSRNAVLFIILNIDDFRMLNDFYGYEAGNLVLKNMANWIQEFIGQKFKVYRFPSDEFAIVSHEKIEKDEVLEFVKRLIGYIEEKTVLYEDNEIAVQVSAGVAIAKYGQYKDFDKLLLEADAALKNAKNLRKKIIVYDSGKSSEEEYKKNTEWIRKIKEAIKEDRVEPYFQPIVNTATKKIEKYEALVRIIDKDGKIVLPYEFLDIAKKSKLYTQITKIVIDKAFRVFENRDEEISINISTLDIESAEIAEAIKNSIDKYDISRRVVFEITESEEVKNYEELMKFARNVKKCSCKLAIDDFGSGYSNFAYILNMGVDYLKIDGSLIKNITSDEKSAALVKAVITFTKELGIKTIAEFVADEEIKRMMENIGVDYMQGFYIGKPVSKEAIT
ncbi:EAL domain-containing protein [Nitrosophilus alvini]|uniref:EAL domain-containing protein n=1 Tax=Nitrosophilus alvini TaxID=2714855 RepID=UPI00190D4D39|nr:EAL domain-containing protein [Nitrosophilus alvini]